MIKNIKNIFRSVITISILINLIAFSNIAMAEYYLVQPVSVEYPCGYCGNISKHHKYHHYVSNHHYVRHHVTHHYAHRTCSGYVWVPGHYEHRSHSFVYFSDQPVSYRGASEPYSRPSCDYDMSTGDDDACSDPNMDIDY